MKLNILNNFLAVITFVVVCVGGLYFLITTPNPIREYKKAYEQRTGCKMGYVGVGAICLNGYDPKVMEELNKRGM